MCSCKILSGCDHKFKCLNNVAAVAFALIVHSIVVMSKFCIEMWPMTAVSRSEKALRFWKL
jgi:hypothetical protein